MNEKIERKVLQFEGFARANASTFDTEDTIAFKVNRYRKMIEATGFGTQTKAEAFLAKAQEALRNNEDVELISTMPARLSSLIRMIVRLSISVPVWKMKKRRLTCIAVIENDLNRE